MIRVMIILPGMPLDLKDIKGGVHAAVANLLHGFVGKEIVVRVLSYNSEIKKRVLVKYTDNTEIIYEPEGSLPFHSLNYFFYGPFILRRNIREFKPDILHYQTGNTLLFTRLLGVQNTKLVSTIHAFAFEEYKTKTSLKDKVTFLYNGFVNELFPVRNIIYISESSRKKHLTKMVKKSALIPNALRSDYFNIADSMSMNNRLLYIGVINNRKNLLHLLETMTRLHDEHIDFSLDVLGGYKDAEYEKKITDYIRHSALNGYVRFHGWVNQQEALRFIENADILVIPSFQETLPMVIAESMAACKVVVSSAVGGIPEMITHNQNGFLFNLTEADGLQKILTSLYNNHEMITIIGSNARKFAITRYYCDQVAEKPLNFTEKYLQLNNMKFLEKLIDNFYIKQWQIGIAKFNSSSISDIDIEKLDFKWIPVEKKSTLHADPFVYAFKSQYYIFYENFCYYENFGKIYLMILNENFEMILEKEILNTGSHLSYPFLFSDSGKLYVLPESSKEPTGNQYAYEFDFEDNSLKNRKTIIAGEKLLDATIFRKDNKYWLFSTKRDKNSESDLYLYHSEKWHENYIPHSLNPIPKGLKNCRSAGNIIMENGEIYRPTQNCERYYGKSIVLNQIVKIDENEFEEKPVKELNSPRNAPNNYAIHTINFSNDVIVIDGLRRIFNPLEQIKIYIAKKFSRN